MNCVASRREQRFSIKFLRRLDFLRIFIILLALAGSVRSGHALSLSLDSIATLGKFPKFCVNTYRWGDRFFNTYDSTYVMGTGTKFNVKFRTESWLDHYFFGLENDTRINMVSDASTAMGVYLTYLAVSVGYDMNMSRYFGGSTKSRKRFNFAFNCALFSADLFFYDNNVGTTITRFGVKNEAYKLHLPFSGLDNKTFGVDLYYFLNNKRYSQAAAFNFSKIQRRSQGSWYFGLSLLEERFKFNFSGLPEAMKDLIPPSWDNYIYHANVKNYSLKAGYAYNWVLGKHWMLGISESPMIGLRKGHVNLSHKNSFSLNNNARFSAVYNRGRLFAGLVGRIYSSFILEKESTMMSNMYSFEASVGYRFNLW